MKKIQFLRTAIIAIFLLTSCVSNIKAQMVYLPDTNFRNALIIQGYGPCITNDSIDASCPNVVNATSINISNGIIQSIEGVQAFVNLQSLNCSNNRLTTLSTLPNSLTYLDCNLNQLTTLPSLSNSLSYLDCSANLLTTLPSLPNSLTYLYCNENQLTTLPALPNSLVQLTCSFNQLTTLPSLPNSLTVLDCSLNQFATLPSLPNSLSYLDCWSNALTTLPVLPNSLTILYCFNNQLTTLPVLPNSLTYLHCGYNQLTALPVLTNSLSELHYDNNQLTTIPALPNSMSTFYCSWNQLTTLPSLPNSLIAFFCDNNQLTMFPNLPDNMNELYCNNNPSLVCLPQLKRIVTFDFSGTGITCLPNYGNVTTSNPPLSTVPLCDLFNSNGCTFYWNINGKSYFDSNSNCIYDSSDVGQPNMHILLYKNGILHQQVFTKAGGVFSIDQLDTGSYIVRLDSSNLPFDVECPLNFEYNDTITSTDSLFYGNDFALRCKNGFDVGAWSMSGRFRPGASRTVFIHAGDVANFYNAHCASGISGSITIHLNGPVRYEAPATGALIPALVIGDSVITFNVADFGAVNSESAFNIIVHTDSLAVFGSQVCISVSVLPLTGDNNPANNFLSQCFAVVNSFDPNEKEVYPAGDIDPNGNRWMTYTIHFQNTGTAPAEHIYVLDTLDANLDLSTFQLLAYSQQPFVQILEGGIAKFNFPNINLADSTSNEPASHGYIQYKIKLKNSASIGTEIKNTAYIYFDFNSPVVTNTTVNTLQLFTHVSLLPLTDFPVSVYPNPSHNEFIVYCPKFTAGKKITLKLYDVIGKEIVFENMSASQFTFHTSDLPSGIYFLKIESPEGIVMKKMVKE